MLEGTPLIQSSLSFCQTDHCLVRVQAETLSKIGSSSDQGPLAQTRLLLCTCIWDVQGADWATDKWRSIHAFIQFPYFNPILGQALPKCQKWTGHQSITGPHRIKGHNHAHVHTPSYCQWRVTDPSSKHVFVLWGCPAPVIIKLPHTIEQTKQTKKEEKVLPDWNIVSIIKQI